MKRLSTITACILLLTAVFSFSADADAKTNLGKQVNWVKIATYNDVYKNAGAVNFESKKSKSKLLTGLDKRIKYVKTSANGYSSNIYVPNGIDNEEPYPVEFEGKQKTRTVTASIIFYDSKRKPIAYQKQQVVLKRFDVKFNAKIRKLSNVGYLKSNPKEHVVSVDLSKLKGKYTYWSFDSYFVPTSLSVPLKEVSSLFKQPKNNIWPAGIYSDSFPKVYATVILYDKNLKPISYIDQTFNSDDFNIF